MGLTCCLQAVNNSTTALDGLCRVPAYLKCIKLVSIQWHLKSLMCEMTQKWHAIHVPFHGLPLLYRCMVCTAWKEKKSSYSFIECDKLNKLTYRKCILSVSSDVQRLRDWKWQMLAEAMVRSLMLWWEYGRGKHGAPPQSRQLTRNIALGRNHYLVLHQMLL